MNARGLQALRIVANTARPTLSTSRVLAAQASSPSYTTRTRTLFTTPTRLEQYSTSPSTSSSPSSTSTGSYRSSPPSQHLYAASADSQKRYLETLLSPLAPLPNPTLIDNLLSERCLTHKSGVEKNVNRRRGGFGETSEAGEGGRNGHNEKMSFVGRRILRLYLTLHLNSQLSASHPSLLAHAVSPRAIDALLNTKQLGATVGAAWKLEDAMRWREVKGPTGEMTGLWKVRGMGVEAVMGGVFTSQGIETASQVFHQLVLPNLTFPQTLRKALDGTTSTSSTLNSQSQQQPEITV
ncbi:hypothetical protein JCM5353_002954 [Sporobolomyces roseus]